MRPSQRLALATLAALLLYLPVIRMASTALVRANGERLLIGSLELLFVAFALCDRELALPGTARAASHSARSARETRFFAICLGLWIAIGATATATAQHIAPAIVRQGEWWTHLLFGVVLWSFLRARPSLASRIVRWVPMAIGIWAVATLLQIAIFGIAILGEDSLRVPGFGNARHLGYQLAFAAVVCAVRLGVDDAAPGLRRSTFGATWITLTAVWLLIFWSGCRASFLASAASILLLIALRAFPRPGRMTAWLLASVLAGALLAAPLPDRGFHGVGAARFIESLSEWAAPNSPAAPGSPEHTHHDSTRPGDTSAPTPSSLEPEAPRIKIQRAAMSAYADHPWLGLGPDAFSFLETGFVQPHNLVSQALLDWGMLGTLPFLFLWLALLALAWTGVLRSRGAPTRVAAFGAMLAALIHSAVDGTLYFANPTMLTICMAAIAALPMRAPSLRTPLPAGPRTIARGAAVLLLLVLLSNLAITRIVSRERPPESTSLAARLLYAFPHRVEALDADGGAFGWARTLWPDDREAAVHWLHFGHRHARSPWRFYFLEARFLWQLGEREAASEHLEIALETATDMKTVPRTMSLMRAMHLPDTR